MCISLSSAVMVPVMLYITDARHTADWRLATTIVVFTVSDGTDSELTRYQSLRPVNYLRKDISGFQLGSVFVNATLLQMHKCLSYDLIIMCFLHHKMFLKPSTWQVSLCKLL